MFVALPLAFLLTAPASAAEWVEPTNEGNMEVLVPDGVRVLSTGLLHTRIDGTGIEARYAKAFTLGSTDVFFKELKRNLEYDYGVKGAKLEAPPACTQGEVDVCVAKVSGRTDAKGTWIVAIGVPHDGAGVSMLVSGTPEAWAAHQGTIDAMTRGFRKKVRAPAATASPPATPAAASAPAAPAAASAPAATSAPATPSPAQRVCDYFDDDAHAVCAPRCEAGDWSACYQLGRRAEFDAGMDDGLLDVAVSYYEEAIRKAEAACSGGNGKGCLDAANFYAIGAGVPEHGQPEGSWDGLGYTPLWPWPEKSKELSTKGLGILDKACAGGDAVACVAFGEAAWEEPVRGAEAFHRACTLGNTAGCEGLASRLESAKKYDPANYKKICTARPELCK